MNELYLSSMPRRGDTPREEYLKMQRESIKKIMESELEKRGIKLSECIIKKNEHGKPYFENHPEIKFNYSHCDGMALIVFSDKEVGVDIEDIKSYNPKIIDKICNEEEVKYISDNDYSDESFFEIWTLKEAYTKAIGMGFAYPPKDVTFGLERIPSSDGIDHYRKLVLKSKYEKNVKIQVDKMIGGYVYAICTVTED